mgnify:CR=1 FL=1
MDSLMKYTRPVTRMGMICMLLLSAAMVNAQSTTDRLQALEDYIAIEQLRMRYAIAFDTGDADGYVGTFARSTTVWEE